MVEIGNFDASQVTPNQAPEILPATWYSMYCVGTEHRYTQDTTGQYVNFVFEMDSELHPSLRGRRMSVNINLWHERPDVRDRAEGDLSALCHATGIMVISNTDQLVGGRCAVKLRIKPADGQYEARNEISGYDNLEKRKAQGQLYGMANASPAGLPGPVGPGIAFPGTAPVAAPPAGPPGQPVGIPIGALSGPAAAPAPGPQAAPPPLTPQAPAQPAAPAAPQVAPQVAPAPQMAPAAPAAPSPAPAAPAPQAVAPTPLPNPHAHPTATPDQPPPPDGEPAGRPW